MTWWQRLWRKSKLEEQLEKELRFHLDQHTDDLTAQGLTPDEARRQSRIDLGGPEQVKEQCRDARGTRWLEDLLQDFRYAARRLRHSPGFTAITVLTLALCIGANTAIFSVINGVLLRPLAYQEADRLVFLWTDDSRRQIHEALTSYLNFSDWKKQTRLFEDLAVFSRPKPLNLTSADAMERIEGEDVSPNLFSLLGVQPALGRSFSAEEADRRERVVVLSHALWLHRFGGAADIIGRTLEIDGKTSQIIGVMPASFEFPDKHTQLWQPHTLAPQWNTLESDRYFGWWRAVGRLKPSVTAQQAQVEMNSIGAMLARGYPTTDGDFAGFGVNVVPLLTQVVGKETPFALSVLLAAVIFVMLIGCANVASLLLARGAARTREFAIRMALGAGSSRLIRQLLTEGALLAVIAGLFGLLISEVGIRTLVAFGPSSIPRLSDITINGNVLAFAGGVSILAGVLCSLAPAWMISRSSPNYMLKDGGRSVTGQGDRRTRSILVITEFALALVLLTGSGLLIRSFLQVLGVDPGFRPDKVLIVQIDFPASKTDAQVDALYQQVIERAVALPGVKSVAAISEFFIQTNPNATVTVEGQMTPSTGQLVKHAVSSDFFQTMGVEFLRGRNFTPEDFRGMKQEGYRVAIINETMARQLWPGFDPIGKRFKDGGPDSTDPWLVVVGVVRDIRRQGLERQPILQSFVPHMPWSSRNQHLLVRAVSNPASLATPIQQVVRSVDKTLPLSGVTTAASIMDESVSQRRFQTILLGLFSGAALILALVGIYGLLSYSVTQRTQELGVRVALGARPVDILKVIVRQGMSLVMIGLAIGLAMAFALTRVMASMLYDISATDPITYTGVSLLLTVVALFACYLPARRASRVDPIVALRYE